MRDNEKKVHYIDIHVTFCDEAVMKTAITVHDMEGMTVYIYMRADRYYENVI